ncbi:MAG: phosphohydrolase, partial [Xanthomonas perforans]|nr:phosphohydrolase [Xanthomonas perforans]
MLLLLTDRPDRNTVLAQLLEQIAPCRVSTVQGRFPGRIESVLGLVADIDLLQPDAARSLRTLRGAAGGARTPLICLMR